MNTFVALFFLGLVQGLTEFLPVSSSGHLVLFSSLFGVEESLFVSVILHVATLLSIFVVFHKDIWHMIRHPFSAETIALAVATIPTCVIVLLLKPLVEISFSGVALPVCFLISAIILALSEFGKKKEHFSCEKISNKTAFFMGVAQGFAVFPGISRSGSTIATGMLVGAKKSEVAKFSFLMSVPIVVLSLLLEVVELCVGWVEVSVGVLPLAVSFVTAFVSGIFAIKVMLKLTEKSSLLWFSLYLVAIAIFSFFVI